MNSKRLFTGLTLLLAALSGLPYVLAAATADAGPRLGLQAYTFRSYSFVESVEFASSLGIRYLQAYPGQRFEPGAETRFHHDMDAALRARALRLLEQKGVRLASYGVITAKDEDEWRRVFAFAQAMGLEDIASEPTHDAMPLVAGLAASTGIRVAIHNHPEPSIYASPDTALAAARPYGTEIGLCADTGHWVRTGYDPVATLRKAEGRLISLHFKDLHERWVRKTHDVPWGTGVSDAAGQIAELRRQNFTGIVYVEYEYNTPALYAEVERSVQYFRKAVAAPLADLIAGRVTPPQFTMNADETWRGGRGADSARWPQPQPLFARDLANAHMQPGGWAWEDDVLVARGKGDIWTRESYGDFALSLEFRCAEGSNSGVFLRTSDIVNWLHTAIEVQILQPYVENPRHGVGAIFDVLAPTREVPITPGIWYKYVITAVGPNIRVWLDGENILNINLDEWTEAGKNPDGTPNKFRTAYKDMARAGSIGLQYHGNPIAFRNLFIEKL
jgi:sugar phosphate isomerase/epimerase